MRNITICTIKHIWQLITTYYLLHVYSSLTVSTNECVHKSYIGATNNFRDSSCSYNGEAVNYPDVSNNNGQMELMQIRRKSSSGRSGVNEGELLPMVDAICSRRARRLCRSALCNLRYFNREHVLSGRLYLSIFIRQLCAWTVSLSVLRELRAISITAHLIILHLHAFLYTAICDLTHYNSIITGGYFIFAKKLATGIPHMYCYTGLLTHYQHEAASSFIHKSSYLELLLYFFKFYTFVIIQVLFVIIVLKHFSFHTFMKLI